MSKISQFHLAFPVTDLDQARRFYGGVLGCPEGRCSDVYVDFDFFGHQIVAHIAPPPPPPPDSCFDGHAVPVPHFGLNLDYTSWQQLADRLKQNAIGFVEEPHARLVGKQGEHFTMFLLDPFGNALEFKAFKDHAEQFLGGFQPSVTSE
ncbi:MAG: VOC family protein [Polyangiales bacterium]